MRCQRISAAAATLCLTCSLSSASRCCPRFLKSERAIVVNIAIMRNVRPPSSVPSRAQGSCRAHGSDGKRVRPALQSGLRHVSGSREEVATASRRPAPGTTARTTAARSAGVPPEQAAPGTGCVRNPAPADSCRGHLYSAALRNGWFRSGPLPAVPAGPAARAYRCTAPARRRLRAIRCI